MGAKLINIRHHPKMSWSQWSREVYIMKCLDFYKIGISANVDERQKAIQACNPSYVEVIYRSGWDFPPSHRANGFERDYHLLLKDFRLHGEWFDLSEENVENVIEWIKDDYANVTSEEFKQWYPEGKIYRLYKYSHRYKEAA